MTRWLTIARSLDKEHLKSLWNVKAISNNGISIVARSKSKINKRVFKRSIPYLIENEIWMLNHLSMTGYVPAATRYDKYTISMVDLGASEPVTNVEEFLEHGEHLKLMLSKYTVRHGDITPSNIIVKKNFPYLIDWAESRFGNDPRPDKRDGTDDEWIDATWRRIIENSK